MTKAFVLMTALPPTKGHLNLIRFAASLPVSSTTVLVCTQPHEPYAWERYEAVKEAGRAIDSEGRVSVRHLFEELEQDPSVEGFWPMWDKIMTDNGFKHGDYVVSSEAYGATLAGRLGGRFIPYDPKRELYYTKATNIRENMVDYFHDILPEFQKHLVTRVTIFGAESTGKTTLSEDLSRALGGHWLFEWARPYLELVGPELDVEAMSTIWKGQSALQRHATMFTDKAFIIQDTDLFSTIGYWDLPKYKEQWGPSPLGLEFEAHETRSDLYIMLKSNIPFEADPLRYGGDVREGSDEYWESILIEAEVNYEVLTESDRTARLETALRLCEQAAERKADSIYFDRKGL